MGNALFFSEHRRLEWSVFFGQSVVLGDLSGPLHVKGYADAAVVSPDRDTAAAHIFAVDLEIEYQRDGNIALQHQPGSGARSVEDKARNPQASKKDHAMPEHRPSRAVWLISLEATAHVVVPSSPTPRRRSGFRSPRRRLVRFQHRAWRARSRAADRLGSSHPPEGWRRSRPTQVREARADRLVR
jgi:hypothetical protein